MISSKNEPVFIRDLGDLTLQLVFDVWWASMNVASKWSTGGNNSRHAPSWRFYLHCGIEQTGCLGIQFIVCHQVHRHTSAHGTSPMGKLLLPKAHIAKLNELTESEVTELTSSMVDETALAILKSEGCRGITIVCSQSQIIFDILVDPCWLKSQTKRYKLAAKDFETSEFHQDKWNGYLMLGFVSAHIPSNTLSNLELRWSYKALHDDLVLPSATTLICICRKEYALTVDEIEEQLPSRKKVSVALDWWTSPNKVAITSVID